MNKQFYLKNYNMEFKKRVLTKPRFYKHRRNKSTIELKAKK